MKLLLIFVSCLAFLWIPAQSISHDQLRQAVREKDFLNVIAYYFKADKGKTDSSVGVNWTALMALYSYSSLILGKPYLNPEAPCTAVGLTVFAQDQPEALYYLKETQSIIKKVDSVRLYPKYTAQTVKPAIQSIIDDVKTAIPESMAVHEEAFYVQFELLLRSLKDEITYDAESAGKKLCGLSLYKSAPSLKQLMLADLPVGKVPSIFSTVPSLAPFTLMFKEAVMNIHEFFTCRRSTQKLYTSIGCRSMLSSVTELYRGSDRIYLPFNGFQASNAEYKYAFVTQALPTEASFKDVVHKRNMRFEPTEQYLFTAPKYVDGATFAAINADMKLKQAELKAAKQKRSQEASATADTEKRTELKESVTGGVEAADFSRPLGGVSALLRRLATASMPYTVSAEGVEPKKPEMYRSDLKGVSIPKDFSQADPVTLLSLYYDAFQDIYNSAYSASFYSTQCKVQLPQVKDTAAVMIHVIQELLVMSAYGDNKHVLGLSMLQICTNLHQHIHDES